MGILFGYVARDSFRRNLGPVAGCVKLRVVVTPSVVLLGAADGAFVLQKDKRTGNAATLDVSGRDQQDQRFCLTRNTERLIWELEKVEAEIHTEPKEPILEEIAKHINADTPDWEGSPAAFVEFLGLDMQPNTLTFKMNVNASRLLNEYHIRYESSRTHSGRKVKLHWEPTE